MDLGGFDEEDLAVGYVGAELFDCGVFGGVPEAFGGWFALSCCRFFAENVCCLDGLPFGGKITPGAGHHVHGVGQYVVGVLNGRIFDQLFAVSLA